MYTDVKIDFYDMTEHCWHVEAWKKYEDKDEGRVVAKIYDNHIAWQDPNAAADSLVMETINQFYEDEFFENQFYNITL